MRRGHKDVAKVLLRLWTLQPGRGRRTLEALESGAPPLLGGAANLALFQGLALSFGGGGPVQEAMMGGLLGFGGPSVPLPRLPRAVSGRRGS